MKRQHSFVLLLGALCAATVTGCAEERAPINRVGANVVEKSFFVGADLASPSDDPEFYWRNYVVDGSISQSLIGIGTWSGVDRVRWEITEDMLIARKAYQWIKGGDDKGEAHATPDGTVVAAYRIESHFDIKNDYNPSTGEELNIVSENTVDQPWYKRQFMRVDWSMNLVDTPLWTDMFLGKMFGDISLQPISYAVEDPNHPDAPRLDPKQGYFDVTNRYYIEPTDSWYFPGIPTCAVVGFFTGSATYECDPQEATVRSSFLRVDPEHDFERLEITRAPGDVVGNPAALDLNGLLVGLAPPGQQGWDPGYGFTDALHHRFAHIHNIWKQSHIDTACNSDDDLDNDGTADACHPSITGYTGNLGSQCDVFAQKCTIPYRDRELKTVGYFVNADMPEELQDPLGPDGVPTARGASEDIIHAWNQLMQNAVGVAREVECRRTGGARDACRAALFHPDKVMVSYGGWLVDRPIDETDVLTLCHNPVRAYDDHDTCGDTGYRARLGDIRHNFMAYWPWESRARYGGIGNWGADPLTGEIRGAAAMIMGRSATHAAAFQRDVIQVALGDISIEDIIEGVPAEKHAHYLAEGEEREAMSAEEIEQRIQSIDVEHVQMTVRAAKLAGNDIAQNVLAMAQMERHSTHDVDAINSTQYEFNAVADPLRGSLFEAQMLDGQWMTSVAGLDPKTPLDSSLDGVSPLRGMDPGMMRAAQSRIHTMMHAKGICFGEAEAPALGSVALQGLARYFAKKYPAEQYSADERGERIYHDLWIEAFKGIAIHEVGHSLGLLHNFASSWDAANYHPGYWQLRTAEGQAAASCEGQPRGEADTCMGPRYLDPATDDERGMADEPRPDISYYGNTSVMEYSQERFGETIGLGQYDLHAMKALYGRVLETFDDAEHGGMTPAEQMAYAPRLMSQLSGEDRVTRREGPFAPQTFPKPTHYTELARGLRLYDAARCRDATDEERQHAAWRLVHGKVCAPPPRDNAAWKDFEHGIVWDGWPDETAPFVKTKPASLAGGDRVRWAYRYGATFNSYFHTQASDAGADPYEATVNAIEQFDARYPWTYFRRKNREFFAEALPMAASRRTFDLLRAYHWNAANRNAFYQTLGTQLWNEISRSDDWHKPTLLAETEMFNALARYILTPEPGDYQKLAQQPVDASHPIYDVDGGGQDGMSFRLGAVDGRFIGDEFNSNPEGGGSWNYLHWMKHAGFGVEKTFALMALADGRPVLSTINRDNYLDGRAVKINFRSDMPEAVDRLLGGVLSEDWGTVGMYVDPKDMGGVIKEVTPRMTPLSNTLAPVVRPSGAPVLFPNVGYKQQLGMLVFGHVYARMNGELTLSNKMRLWIHGQHGEIDVPEEQQVRFYDPISGYTYVARLYGDDVIDGTPVDRGIGSRMVQHANALLAAAYEVERDAEGQVVVDDFGTPVLVTDEHGQPIMVSSDRLGELTDYVGLMDAARQIAAIVGYGPL